MSSLVPSADRPDPEPVPALWVADPVGTFERLRDCACEAMEIAIEIHEAARRAPRSAPLPTVRPDLHDRLFRAVDEAQPLYAAARRYIDRADGPVHLDAWPGLRLGRVSGTSYHELVLMVTSTLWRGLQAGTPIGDWLDYTRFGTAAGDGTASRWQELLAHVGCECASGIAAWTAASGATPAPPPGQTAEKPLRVTTATETAAEVLEVFEAARGWVPVTELTPGEVSCVQVLIDHYPRHVVFTRLKSPPASHANHLGNIKRRLRGTRFDGLITTPGNKGKGGGGGFGLNWAAG